MQRKVGNENKQTDESVQLLTEIVLGSGTLTSAQMERARTVVEQALAQRDAKAQPLAA